MMRWGLLPHWAKDDKIGYSTFNARSEDFRTKPAFRDAWKWASVALLSPMAFTSGKSSMLKAEPSPYAIATADGAQMVMAGVWAKWRSDGAGAFVAALIAVDKAAPTVFPAPLFIRLRTRFEGDAPLSEKTKLAIASLVLELAKQHPGASLEGLARRLADRMKDEDAFGLKVMKLVLDDVRSDEYDRAAREDRTIADYLRKPS
jgi:hypothetical protein